MKFLMKFGFAIIGIILTSGLHVLISGLVNGELRLVQYFKAIREVLQNVWPIQEFAVFNYSIQRDMLLYPNIVEYIEYSLQILFLSLAVAVVSALGLTVLTMLLPERARDRVKTVLYFLESIPDLLIIMLAQLLIIMIFKKTDVLISKIAVVGDERLFALPVLCLMILPMIQLYRLSMLTFQEEERQQYVELARALGFSKAFIVLKHMFRNAIISVFFQSKKTMWFMLSNLFVLELMFNLPGIMLFLQSNLSPELFLVTVFSFFFPVFLLYSAGEWYFLRKLHGKEAA